MDDVAMPDMDLLPMGLKELRKFIGKIFDFIRSRVAKGQSKLSEIEKEILSQYAFRLDVGA